jgi:hypothetical protein
MRGYFFAFCLGALVASMFHSGALRFIWIW